MKLAVRALIQLALHRSPRAALAAAAAAGGGRCVELNFRAAELQGGDSCALVRAVVGGLDVFARENGDLVRPEIDATCGFRPDGVVRRDRTCVEGVSDVVVGMADEGCEVTGGTTVESFISTVYEHREGFAHLTELVCKQMGRCFKNVQRTILYCDDNPTKEGCMEYVPCDCQTDLLSAVETLSDDGTGGGFLELDAAIVDGITVAGMACRCEDLNRRAASLESRPSCALAGKIVQGRNILAGDAATMAETCSVNTDRTCVEDVVDVVDGFIKYDCKITDANPNFMFALKSNGDDFEKTADFACNNDCYASLRTCHYYYGNDDACMDSLSCKCKRDVVAFAEGLSPDSRKDLLKVDDSAIDEIRAAIDDCECNKLNERAASLRTEGYCALHASIVRGGHVFAGDSARDVQSTCSERKSCVGNVTKVIGDIDDEGCEVKQDTDAMAKFLYHLNDNGEWDELTGFVCGGAPPSAPGGGCYDEMKVVVEVCKIDAVDGCTQSARSECLGSFVRMVDRLSDGAKDDLLGIEASVLGRIRSWNVTESPTTAPPTGEPSTVAPTQQPTSGALVRVSMTAIVTFYVACVSCFLF